MNYRREIDGLRGIAVSLVVLSHTGYANFAGGFIGVDVFFVISGYLITAIIKESIENENFSLIDFYEKRARRILPALIFILITTSIVSTLVLLPKDSLSFAKSIIWTIFFSSNIFYWRDSSYFDPLAEFKPLLHTWSLAVEEQFYFLFPLVLIFMQKLRSVWLTVFLLLILLISFFVAEWGSINHPSAAFYLLPARGWELLIGSLIALNFPIFKTPNKRLLSDIMALIGFVMIILSALLYNTKTPFPGYSALVPTIGTALIIIFANNQNIIGKILGSKILVGIGLISYSIYLWHQPIFSLFRHYTPLELTITNYFSLITLTILLAALTWKFIERPFRKKALLSSARIKKIFSFGIFVLIGFSFFSLITDGTYKFNSKTDTNIELENRFIGSSGLSPICDGNLQDIKDCKTGQDPNLIVWGDSYAAHLIDGFIASNSQVSLVQKTKSACGPILDISPRPNARAWAKECIEFNEKTLAYIQNNTNIKYVVMSSIFDGYVGPGAKVINKSGELLNGPEVTLEYLRSTLLKILSLGKTVIIFSPTPQTGRDAGHCLIKTSQFNLDKDVCNFSTHDVIKYQEPVIALLSEIQKYTSVVWLHDGLCSGEQCRTYFGDTLIYRDKGHLTKEGGQYLGRDMDFYNALSSQQRSLSENKILNYLNSKK